MGPLQVDWTNTAAFIFLYGFGLQIVCGRQYVQYLQFKWIVYLGVDDKVISLGGHPLRCQQR